MQQDTITVLGAGYVGLTTAALLAHAGYKVYVVEPNTERLEVIKQGRSFFYEEGLDAVIKHAVDSGSLIPTDSYEESVPNSSIIFSCVGTPDRPDGSSNLDYVFMAAEQAAKLAVPGVIYVQKSTVPVGTGTRIESLFQDMNVALSYVSNPEFLREGTALSDTLFFDRVVVGGNDKEAVETVLGTYRNLEQSSITIADIAAVPHKTYSGEYIATSLNSAELIKVTANAFLALKISFANSIALLADKAGADVREVMDAVGADDRIGRKFLNAGRGYGGGCFPKDVSGLISSALEYGVDLEIMQAAQQVNNGMPSYIVSKLQDSLEEPLNGKRVAVLGLAFKAGTSDVRKSPGIAIANTLARSGATVCAFDPQANEEAKPDLLDTIEITDSIESAITNADITIITTEWKELLEYPAQSYADKMSGSILFDAVNLYDSVTTERAGLTYLGVGR